MKEEDEKMRPNQFTELKSLSVQTTIKTYLDTGENSFTVT
jgi:hypothetical protein